MTPPPSKVPDAWERDLRRLPTRGRNAWNLSCFSTPKGPTPRSAAPSRAREAGALFSFFKPCLCDPGTARARGLLGRDEQSERIGNDANSRTNRWRWASAGQVARTKPDDTPPPCLGVHVWSAWRPSPRKSTVAPRCRQVASSGPRPCCGRFAAWPSAATNGGATEPSSPQGNARRTSHERSNRSTGHTRRALRPPLLPAVLRPLRRSPPSAGAP